MTLLIQLEIKDIVDHVILLHFHKQLRQDSNWNMANKSQLYHLNKFCSVISWMKGAREDGLKLILSLWKEPIWFLKNVLLIKAKLKVENALTMKNVSHLLKFKALILLEEDGPKFPKNKWWKKYWWMVQFQYNSKPTDFFQHTKVVFYLKRELRMQVTCLLSFNK